MSDIEQLKAQLKKYKDKKGRKAISLQERIEGLEAMERIINRVLTSKEIENQIKLL